MFQSLQMLQSELRQCTRCVDAGYIPEARPLVLGNTDARFMVIGQAPSRIAHESNMFYRGPAGEKLRGWFVQAGFSQEDFGTRIYLAAITRCFPGRKPGSSKDRLPERTEQALCRPWLNEELRLLNPRVVFLFGGLATTTFLSRRPLVELIGKRFEQGGKLYVPLPHSSGASTWLNDSANRELLQQAIGQIADVRVKIERGE